MKTVRDIPLSRLLMSGAMMLVPLLLCAQTTVIKSHRQQKFAQELPAGNYSGIAWLGDDRYAVVSDKGDDGFYVFRLTINNTTGRIENAENLGFHPSGEANQDAEGIVYVHDTQSLFVCSEAKGTVTERFVDGRLTGRTLKVPEMFRKSGKNTGLESLAYDNRRHIFWTTSESTLDVDGERATSMNGVANRLRLQAFGDNLQPIAQFAYLMDVPKTRKKGRQFVHGVSELVAIGDGCLLVLERELFVPKRKIGAYAICKLFEVHPIVGDVATDKTVDAKSSKGFAFTTHSEERVESIVGEGPLSASSPFLEKRLLAKWTTRMNLFRQNLANYEGMCLGPTLSDGRRTLILIADSQNRYGGLLRDWFKCLVLNGTTSLND